MSEYAHARAALDPLGTIYLDDGGRLQDVSVILIDQPDSEPVGIALLACQARELAFELLELAEQADRERTSR